jgi:hypothetical protein
MTTKHDCGGPVFGRKTPGCPRCDELIGGAKPVQWNIRRRESDEEIARRIRAHDCRQSECSVVCTAFDW